MKRCALLFLVLLAGCAATGTGGKKLNSDFKLEYLAKSDLDMVAEAHQKTALDALRLLTEKLYKRNPKEWRKSGFSSPEAATARIFDVGLSDFSALGGRRGPDAIYLAFDENWNGDRVLAFAAGLRGMLLASYNNKTELYLPDDLDPQKLYNSARNVEIAAWKLTSKKTAAGELFLISNETEGPVKNLSFERELGKVIASQDTLARVVAEKTNRSIVRVVQSLATAVFCRSPFPNRNGLRGSLNGRRRSGAPGFPGFSPLPPGFRWRPPLPARSGWSAPPGRKSAPCPR